MCKLEGVVCQSDIKQVSLSKTIDSNFFPSYASKNTPNGPKSKFKLCLDKLLNPHYLNATLSWKREEEFGGSALYGFFFFAFSFTAVLDTLDELDKQDKDKLILVLQCRLSSFFLFFQFGNSKFQQS